MGPPQRYFSGSVVEGDTDLTGPGRGAGVAWGLSRPEYGDFLALPPEGPEGVTMASSTPRAPWGSGCI